MLIQDFLTYIRCELNYSAHTVLSYQTDLKQWREWSTGGNDAEDFRPAEVTAADLRAFMAARADCGDSAATLRRKAQALRAFYRYLMRQGITTANPARALTLAKLPKPLPVFVREDEMESVLAGENPTDDFTEVRDRLIVLMLYTTGIRASELMGLRDVNVDTTRCELKVLGKRNKERIIPFGSELASAIEHYRRVRHETGTPSTDEFFVRPDGSPLYYMLLNRIVHKSLDAEVRAERRSPHVLRHSFATGMINGGASLNGVQQLLGHNSLATTQIYTHISYRDLQQNYQHAHPRAHKQKGG